MKIKIKNTIIRTVLGDITKVDFADAIVNSASNSIGGNGINSAIHKAAGKGLMVAYQKLGGCEVGEAKVTPAFNLPCKQVIHTVGPIWKDGDHNEVNQLADCYKNSLGITYKHLGFKIRSIAFPSISTGVHGFPLDKAAYVAVHAVFDFMTEFSGHTESVYWVLHDQQTKDAYDKALVTLVEELDSHQNGDKYGVLGFYHEYEPYGCFSNWYPAAFDYAGKHFANSEQYMMYHKVMMFGKSDLAEQIMLTSNPMVCKKIAGQKFSEFKSETWESTCHTIMRRGIKAKFSQNTGIRQILLNTQDSILAECSPTDPKWGIRIALNDPDRLDVSKWNGKNMLGRILMEVREELRLERTLLFAAHKVKHTSVDIKDLLDPIAEWNIPAGKLVRIPQYYSTVHAYADTIPVQKDRNRFYYDCSLYEWELQMRNNKGNGLPAAGFYELKQDVYDIAERMKAIKGRTPGLL